MKVGKLAFLLCLLIFWYFPRPFISVETPETHDVNGAMNLDMKDERRPPSAKLAIGGKDEQVEGCFNNFIAKFAVSLAQNNFSNLRCQAICTERGYALAATGGGSQSICWCGNDYPGLPHEVDTFRCDRPCSLDKKTCHLFTCCGDRNGSLFTVSWNGEVNPVKHLLGRLSEEYRSSTIFRQNIINDYLLSDNRSSFQLCASDKLPENPPLYLSVGNGCPVGWCKRDGWCYKQHWADPSTYDEAQDKCQLEGGELVNVRSSVQNAFVLSLYAGCLGWLHIESYYEGATLHIDQNFGEISHLQLKPDGSWIALSGYDSDRRVACFACQKACTPPFPALRPHEADEWDIEISAYPSSTYAWCTDCAESYLKNVNTHLYLCVDDQYHLYLSMQPESSWCIWTIKIDPDTGAITFLSHHNAILTYQAERNELTCRSLPSMYHVSRSFVSRNHRMFDGSFLNAPDGLAIFNPSSLPLSIKEHYLRIAVHSLNRRSKSAFIAPRGLQECSMAVWDMSPQSDTFMCRPLVVDNADIGVLGSAATISPLVFKQKALHVYDQSSYVTAREPLPNGRVTCLNQNPTETVSCVLAYGRAIILIRRFRTNFGILLFDTVADLFQVSSEQRQRFRFQTDLETRRPEGDVVAGKERRRSRPNEVDFLSEQGKLVQNALTGSFNTFYQFLFFKELVDVRTWQLGINVAPLTALTIQLWMTTQYLKYRWRAVFQPRGGFTLTLFGRRLSGQKGATFSLGDLVVSNDILYSMYGSYEEPVEVALTMTDSEHIELSYLGLPLHPWSDNEM